MHPLLAIVVSLLSAGYLWIATVKVLEAERQRPSHDLAGLIGAARRGQDSHLQRRLRAGRCASCGVRAAATPIAEGSLVRVTGRDGLILEVEPVNLQEN